MEGIPKIGLKLYFSFLSLDLFKVRFFSRKGGNYSRKLISQIQIQKYSNNMYYVYILGVQKTFAILIDNNFLLPLRMTFKCW